TPSSAVLSFPTRRSSDLMFDEQLFELLELPFAAVPLDQIFRVGHLRSRRLHERGDRLTRSREGGAIDRGRFRHLAPPSRERVRRPEEHTAVLQSRSDIVR